MRKAFGLSLTICVMLLVSVSLTYSAGWINVTPRFFDYGTVEVEDEKPQTFIVKNKGLFGTLNVTSITLVGADSNQFFIDGDIPFSLEPGDWKGIVVTFKPTASGNKSAILRILSNSFNNRRLRILLLGKGGIEPPTNLTATAGFSSQIDLSWTDNSDMEDGFIIERKWSNEGFLPIDTVGPNEESYSDVGLPNGTRFTYRVCAYRGVNPLNPDESSDYSNEDGNLAFGYAGPAPPAIREFNPPEGNLDVEIQDVKVKFTGAMNTKSVLVNSYFERKNVTDCVTEITATISDFLYWFGDKSKAMKYNRYGCTPPYGVVDASQVDITFTGEGGRTYDTLEITLPNLTIGEPKKEIGAKEYLLSILVPAAEDLAGIPLDLEGHIKYRFSFTEETPIDGETGDMHTGLDGTTTVAILEGSFDGTSTLKLNPYSTVDILPEPPEGIRGFVPLKKGIIGRHCRDIRAIGFEFNPPVDLLKPIRILMRYRWSIFVPGEESIRMYRYDFDEELWKLEEGFQLDRGRNQLYIDYEGPTTYCLFALMSGYPDGDVKERTRDASAIPAPGSNSNKLTKIKLNDDLTSVKLEQIPHRSMLLQNYPNPFNPETWIPYKLSKAADVTIRIYDVDGNLVRRFHLGEQMPGNYVTKDKSVYWNGCDEKGEKVASGVYFYQFKANEKSFVRKMILLK
jgi:hypothetical protein